MGSEETAWTTTDALGVASFSWLTAHESVAASKDCNIVSYLATQNCGTISLRYTQEAAT
jgi:hypothetical protein